MSSTDDHLRSDNSPLPSQGALLVRVNPGGALESPKGAFGAETNSGRRPRVALVLKLTLAFALTLLALEFVILVTGHQYWREVLQTQIHAHLSAVTDSRREMVESAIALLRQKVAVQTERPDFRRYLAGTASGTFTEKDRASSQKRLERMVDGKTVFSSSLVDTTGKVLLSSDPAEVGRERGPELAFQNGLRESYLGIPRQLANHLEATTAAPVVYRTETVGVLILNVSPSAVGRPLQDITGLGESGEVMLLVRDGEHIVSLFPSRYGTEMPSVSIKDAPDLAGAIGSDGTFLRMRDYRGETVLAAGSLTRYRGWTVLAKMDEREAYAPIDRALQVRVFYGLLVAGVGVLAAYALARRFTRPVRRLSEAAVRVAKGDYDSRVNVKTNDELGALAASFNEMTAAIRARGAQRDQAEEALRAADRHKDEFIAMLGHELRNPLSAIAAGVVLWKEKSDDPVTAGIVREVIERQTGNLERLVDDLLDVARIATGKIELRKRPVDVTEIITHAVEAVRPLIEERHHQLDLSFAGGGGQFRVDADPTRIEQVVMNLIANAAKYTPDGGCITVTERHAGHEAEIVVSDNGIGIAPDVLPKIFDLFTQADRSLDRRSGGLGIGLNLSRYLVELHGGTLSAHSAGLGRGAEFTVRLPTLPDASLQAVSSLPAPRAAGRAGRRILLADDNTDTALLLSQLLVRRGHEVLAVHDGTAALQAAREFHPEVLLLDIGLPDIDGYELTRRLRADGFANAQIIAISGYAQETDRELAREAGFDHHFAKPVDFEALATLIAERSFTAK